MTERISKHPAIEFPQPIKELAHSPVKRVLLINPNHGGSEGFQVAARTEPLGLEYVAGAVTDIVEKVSLHDDSSMPGGWKEKISSSPPEMIGMSCNYTVAVPEVRKLAEEIRKIVGKDIPIVAGGHAISLKPTDLYHSAVDAIVIGDGEKTFRNAVNAWGKKHSFETVENIHYRKANGEFVSNVAEETSSIGQPVELNSPSMDKRPLPRRDLADPFRDKYYVLYYPGLRTMEASRGCTNHCIFCSGHQFNKGMYRAESWGKTIEQLKSIPDKSYILLPDDFAFLDVEGANQIADHLIQTKSKRRLWAQTRADHIAQNPGLFEKLHEAGLDMLLVGFESFDSESLKKVGKGIKVDQNIQYNLKAVKVLKEIGVKIWGAQILFPNFTRENFLRIAELNNKLKIDYPQFAIYTPLPGTELYKQQLRQGNLTGNEDPRQFDLFHSVLPTTLPKEEFHAWRDWLYLQTGFTPPSRIKQDVREGFATWKDVKEFRERVSKTYDTPDYRTLVGKEGKKQIPIEIFSASDIQPPK